MMRQTKTEYLDTSLGPVPYKILHSSRKTMAIQIKPGGNVYIRVPFQVPMDVARAFAVKNQEWIYKNYSASLTERTEEITYSQEEIRRYRRQAAECLEQRVSDYAQRMSLVYGRITIRQQKTRWGSCSSRGNLNFNWKLILMPPPILDYVVVHELAHLREMNHSARFWELVAQYIPDYRERRKWLREHGKEY